MNNLVDKLKKDAKIALELKANKVAFSLLDVISELHKIAQNPTTNQNPQQVNPNQQNQPGTNQVTTNQPLKPTNNQSVPNQPPKPGTNQPPNNQPGWKPQNQTTLPATQYPGTSSVPTVKSAAAEIDLDSLAFEATRHLVTTSNLARPFTVDKDLVKDVEEEFFNFIKENGITDPTIMLKIIEKIPPYVRYALPYNGIPREYLEMGDIL